MHNSRIAQISTPNSHQSVFQTSNRKHFQFVLILNGFHNQSDSLKIKRPEVSEKLGCDKSEKWQLQMVAKKKKPLELGTMNVANEINLNVRLTWMLQ